MSIFTFTYEKSGVLTYSSSPDSNYVSTTTISEVIIAGVTDEPLSVKNSSGSVQFAYDATTNTLKVQDLLVQLNLTNGEPNLLLKVTF